MRRGGFLSHLAAIGVPLRNSYNTKTAGAILGRSPKTIANWCRRAACHTHMRGTLFQEEVFKVSGKWWITIKGVDDAWFANQP